MDTISMRLLVTKINFLGDAVTFLPTLQGIRSAIPDASITMVCSRSTASIFQRSVDGLEVHAVDFSKTRGPLSVLTALSETYKCLGKRYDFALHAHDEPSFSYLLSRFLGVRRRIGYSSRIARASKFLTEEISFGLKRNIVDTNFDLVRYVTHQVGLQPKRVPIDINGNELANVDKMLKDLGWNNDQPIVLIHPHAKLPYREWGIDNFQVVGAQLSKITGAFVAFVSETTGSSTDFPRNLSNLTIHEFAALCSKARLLVCNNSGPMHVAAAMGTCTLSIEGPSPPEWSVYWTDQKHARIVANDLSCLSCESLTRKHGTCTNVEYPNACMHEVKPETVVDHALKFLSA